MSANRLKGPFGTRDDAGGTRVRLEREAKRARERLENGFALVMRILAAQVVDVQGGQRVVDESLEELVREVDVELADTRARKRHVPFQARTAGEVDHDA